MKFFTVFTIGLPLIRRSFLMLLFAFATALIPSISNAQADSNPANCNAITDPDMQFQADLCKAHAGCRLVYAVHDTCVKAKRFLTNLKDAIGEGTKSFFGYKKEVTPEAVWQANLSDTNKEMNKKPEWRERLDLVDKVATPNLKEAKTGTNANNKPFASYGKLEDGNLTGYGVDFYSDGSMYRGIYKSGRLNGASEEVYPSGTQYVGNNIDHKRTGDGILKGSTGIISEGNFDADKFSYGKKTQTDGRFQKGTFEKDGSVNGQMFRANGTLLAEGAWDAKGELDVGKIYDTAGKVMEERDRAKEREIAAEIKRKEVEADLASKRRQEDLQRAKDEAALTERNAAVERQAQARRDAQARAEQDYRNSLNTLNAGQLFAKADEYSSSGDSSKAREVLRALVSRFPDHPLAASAAQRMTAASQQNAGTQASNNSNTQSNSGQASNTSNCDAKIAAQEKEFEAVNKRPLPDGATPGLKRVMWMTSERIKLVKSNCPSGGKYQQMINELQTANNQAATACMQLTAGGACTPNPYDGTVTNEMRAEMARNQAQNEAAERAQAKRLAELKEIDDLNKFNDALKGLANALQQSKKSNSAVKDCWNCGLPGQIGCPAGKPRVMSCN